MMRKLMLLVLVGLGLTCLPLMAQPGGDVRIIPRPQQAALTSTSSHALTEGHAIHAPAALAAEADYLAEELAARGLNFLASSSSSKNSSPLPSSSSLSLMPRFFAGCFLPFAGFSSGRSSL